MTAGAALVGVLSTVVVYAHNEDGVVLPHDDDAQARDEALGYPPATLTPNLDLGLQEVSVEVPEEYRDEVPAGLTLNLPPGFSVKIFAAGLRRPRAMAISPDGVLHVTSRSGVIIALPDRDGDGVADEHVTVLDNLRTSDSIAFYKGDMYVGEEHQVVRAVDSDGDGIYEARKVFVPDLPWEGWHDTRTIVFDEQNEKLYVSVGSPCDLCRMEPGHQFDGGSATDTVPYSRERGTVLEFNADGTGRRIFATGVRNVVGMDLHPITNELWATNNGHDLEGRSRPPEWIDVLRDGDFQGYPFVQSYHVWNDFSIERYHPMLPITRADTLLAMTQRQPAVLVPAHWAPMRIHFYTGHQFPEIYRNAAFVAFHAGRAKLSSHPGYKVQALFSDPDGSNAHMADFITGFQTGTATSTVWGFPHGLTSDAEGSLYVSSDNRNEVILKITHSPVGGSWENNLPESIAAGSSLRILASVRIDRLAPEGGAVRVTADLSELGGPRQVELTPADEDTYALDFDLHVDGQGGIRTLRILLEQEIDGEFQGFRFVHSLLVVPPDLPVLDDVMAGDWSTAARDGARVVGPTETGPVFSGKTALAVEVAPEKFLTPWSFGLAPASPLSRQGFVGVRFAFHPGDVEASGVAQFTLFVDGLGLDLARGPESPYQIDFGRRQWQVLEVPFTAFEQENRYDGSLLDAVDVIDGIRFEGNLTGTFYLDDVRVVGAIPAPPPSATTAVVEPRAGVLPVEFTLWQNFPNPFNGETVIRFSLTEAAPVHLRIYSLTGQRLATLVEGRLQAGTHVLRWDGRDDQGRKLATGVYHYRLRAGSEVATRKLLLVR